MPSEVPTMRTGTEGSFRELRRGKPKVFLTVGTSDNQNQKRITLSELPTNKKLIIIKEK